MDRIPPGEARAQTRKARKASGNPRKAKVSEELERNNSGLEVGRGGQDVGRGAARGFDYEAGYEADFEASQDLGHDQLEPKSGNIKTEGQIKRAAKAQQKLKKDHRKKVLRRVLIVLVCVVIAAIIALCVAFAIYRWNTFSDEEDIQGTWYVEKTELPIVITEDKIELTDGVAYSYKIDPESKTIEFKFGNMTGKGRYRFSLDRQQLSIMDGEYEYWDTLFDDAAWMIQAVIRDIQGLSMLNPGIEGNMISEGTLTLLKKPLEESSGVDDGEAGSTSSDDSANTAAAAGGAGSANGANEDSEAKDAKDASEALNGSPIDFTQMDVKDR